MSLAARKYKVDLHNHTPLIPNDYKGSLSTSGLEIVEAALDAGIDVLAISDHFAIEFFQNVYWAAEQTYKATGRKLLVVPGSELKITWRGEEVHLITLFPSEHAEELFEELMAFIGVDNSERIIERLPKITVEIDPAIVINKVCSAGGMCHLAHVDRFFGNYRLMDGPLIDKLIKETPISAIEIVQRENSADLKKRTNGIRHIQSSDSHCTTEIGRRCTELQMNDLSFESLKCALSHG